MFSVSAQSTGRGKSDLFSVFLGTYLLEFIQGCRIFMDIKPLIELTIRNDFSLKKFFEKLTKTHK